MKTGLPAITRETVVFTKHARERLSLRRLSEDMVIQVMQNTNQIYPMDDGKTKFVGKAMGAKVHAICKSIPEENKWLVISLWVRGEDDAGNFTYKRQSYRGRRSLADKIVYRFFSVLVIIAIILFFASQQR